MKFNDNFLKACRREETPYTPLWLARQAGRYQKEYMKIKEKYSIIDISTIPEVSAEVTLLPINQFELDSAIIFSDIGACFLSGQMPFLTPTNFSRLLRHAEGKVTLF